MEKKQIEQLIQKGLFPFEQQAKVRLIETAISYVILKGSYAYKIKKNSKLSFLDFSTLKKRRHYCYEELRLNKRLAKEMYLDVLSVTQNKNQWKISKTAAGAIDYAVLMKRMNPLHQLNVLLKKNNIQTHTIKDLGKTIASFHLKEKSLIIPYDPFFLSREFADIRHFNTTIENCAGEEYTHLVLVSIQLSDSFIILQQDFIRSRVKDGYVKNCHGDLHSQNIFIEKKPVIFDCIEFRDAFRQIDVLNEIAFLCMDLEIHGQKSFSKLFLKTYLNNTGFLFGPKEKLLFIYFKAYRACIRAKVSAIALAQHPDDVSLQSDVKKYIKAMAVYLTEAVAAM